MQFRSDPSHTGVYATSGPLTPKVVWTLNIDAAASSPAVANGVVYVGSEDKNVYALDATTAARYGSFRLGMV